MIKKKQVIIHRISRRAIVAGAATLAAAPAVAQTSPSIPGPAPQGRLTLSSGVAVTTADIGASGAVLYTPTLGRFIPIWDGSQFVPTDIGGELSNVLADSSAGKAGPAAAEPGSAYFYMVWSDGGTPRLTRSPKWVNVTDPGTGAGSAEPQFVGGIRVNKYDIVNGPAVGFGTIVGGICTDAAALAEDSAQHRYVSNLYNAVPRSLRVIDMAQTWEYSVASWRTAHGDGNNVVAWFHAGGGRLVTLDALGIASSSIANVQAPLTSIGIDSPFPAAGVLEDFNVWPVVSRALSSRAHYVGYPGQGLHIGHWLEFYCHLGLGGVGTWYGNATGQVTLQSGMTGWTEN